VPFQVATGQPSHTVNCAGNCCCSIRIGNCAVAILPSFVAGAICRHHWKLEHPQGMKVVLLGCLLLATRKLAHPRVANFPEKKKRDITSHGGAVISKIKVELTWLGIMFHGSEHKNYYTVYLLSLVIKILSETTFLIGLELALFSRFLFLFCSIELKSMHYCPICWEIS
jgi:hypothetical protein